QSSHLYLHSFPTRRSSDLDEPHARHNQSAQAIFADKSRRWRRSQQSPVSLHFCHFERSRRRSRQISYCCLFCNMPAAQSSELGIKPLTRDSNLETVRDCSTVFRSAKLRSE